MAAQAQAGSAPAEAPAEQVARFIVERVQRAKGPRWDQGPGRVRLVGQAAGPGLDLLARRRLSGVSEAVVRGLWAWGQGERPAVLLFRVPQAREVLAFQAQGRRCVSLVEDAVALAHGDPRHPDGLAFVLHDLEHLEKFVDPAHHRGQVGFFRSLNRALEHPAWMKLEQGLDATWRAERDYVFADMNGSAVFLFAALKMKLRMAVRRWLGANTEGGPLSPEEERVFFVRLAWMLDALELSGIERLAAGEVTARRGHPQAARRLLDLWEQRGALSV